MLVLSRRVGEQVHVGNGIVLTVVAVQGSRVRLGIEAPRSLPIWRPGMDRRKPTVGKEMVGASESALEAVRAVG